MKNNKVFLIEDNSLTAFNTCECFLENEINHKYYENLVGVLSYIDDDILYSNEKIILVVDLNLPYEGSNFTKIDKEKTDVAQFTGWVWLYNNIFSNWGKYKQNIDKIIIYSAFIKYLDNYFKKYPDEKKFIKEVKYLNKSATTDCYNELVKEINDEK